MTLMNPQLDRDVEDALAQTRVAHLAGIAKAKASSGNWVASAIAILILAGVIGWGLIRESWMRQIHARTCDVVSVKSQLDQAALEFLAKNCVSR